MRRIFALFGLMAVPAHAAPAPATQAQPYKIVVNASCKASSLTRAQAADYFLKKASRWPDGTAVVVVDLSSTTSTREAFSKDVLGKSVDAVMHYWQEQIFAGRGTPPKAKSEAEVLAFVGSTDGGIGYVGANVTLATGTKATKVE
jgi:ABC-type phosphate transport system substrate-binding protein